MEVTAAERTTTYTREKTLAEKLYNLVHVQKKVQIAEISRELPYSRPSISRYISGHFNSPELEKYLTEWYSKYTGTLIELPTHESSKKAGQKPHFFESRDAKSILGVCQSSQEYIGLGIIVGRSGRGKTYTLKQYAKLPRVAYIECDDTMGGRDLVEAIERSIGLSRGYGSIWNRANGIREFFNTNRGYLLIVDEADKLISKHTQKKMEILRAIFDQSDVGLVIAGEPKLEAQVKTFLDRMANRFDFYAKLDGLTPSEVESYLGDFDMAPDALLELKARACNMQTGCFRLLDRTLSNVRRILDEKGESVVTVKIIEQASGMMML